MEYVPSVFDAIQWLVAEDINVVEPSANGAHDLDADYDGKGGLIWVFKILAPLWLVARMGWVTWLGRVVLLMVQEWMFKGGLIAL